VGARVTYGFDYLLACVIAGDEDEVRAGYDLRSGQMVESTACVKKFGRAHAAGPGRGELDECRTGERRWPACPESSSR